MWHTRESFWTLTERFPPILIRLLATDPPGHPLTTAEIADRSGLSPALVEAISQSTDWTGIDLPTAKAYLLACKIDLTNGQQIKRITTYLRYKKRNGVRIPTPYQYLRKSPLWETYYQPLRDRLGRFLLSKQSAATTPNASATRTAGG